MREVITAQMIT